MRWPATKPAQLVLRALGASPSRLVTSPTGLEAAPPPPASRGEGRPDMPTLPQEHAAGRRRLLTGRSRLPSRRRLAGALTGLLVLPLLTLGITTVARGRLNLAS